MEYYERILGSYGTENKTIKCYGRLSSCGSLWLRFNEGVDSGKPVPHYYPLGSSTLWSLEKDLNRIKVKERCIQTEWEF